MVQNPPDHFIVCIIKTDDITTDDKTITEEMKIVIL